MMLPQAWFQLLTNLASIFGTVALVFYAYAWLGISAPRTPRSLSSKLLTAIAVLPPLAISACYCWLEGVSLD